VYIFQNATSFNQPLNNWYVKNITDMYGMFMGATSFNQDLHTWNTQSFVSGGNFAAKATFTAAYAPPGVTLY